MKFLIRPDQVYFNFKEVFVFKFLKKLDSKDSRIPHSEGSLPRKHNFLKFKHENVIKMKNKPAPALLRPSTLSSESKKLVPKSRETIP
jgi:hypothetical protein